jgi:hypothetical protein
VLGEKSSAVKVKRLDEQVFNLVASAYDNSNKDFNSLYTKWKRVTRKRIPLDAWKPYPSQKVTPIQNEMRKITNRVRDISRAEMDGLLFRTAANQEKFLIDNACVVYPYNQVTFLVTYMSICMSSVCFVDVDVSSLVGIFRLTPVVLRFNHFSYVLTIFITFHLFFLRFNYYSYVVTVILTF